MLISSSWYAFERLEMISSSGYTFEELLLDSKDKLELLSKIDILVDGRFQEGFRFKYINLSTL